MPDLPSGHRQERLREISAALYDAPQSGYLPRRQLAAPNRPNRLHGVPRRDGAVGQLPRRRSRALRREAESRVGEEVGVGGAAPLGLPDAAAQDDGGVVREVPSAGDLPAEG